MEKIQSSLDWAEKKAELENLASKSGKHRIQMKKIVNNISEMISDLSREEINCRRKGKQTATHAEILDNINKEIGNFESLMTFGLLLNDND
jgi:F0F1-type ATP synthase gamma subunit